MADESGSPFGGGFLDDLSSLLGGGSGGGAAGGPQGGPEASTTQGASPATTGTDDFAARLRGYEDVVNGLA